MAEKNNKSDSLGFENFENPTKEKSEVDVQDEAISFSVKLVKYLNGKMKEHNSLAYKSKVSLSDLQRVYVNAGYNCAQAKSLGKSCGEWVLARVNMYLRQKLGGKMISIGTKAKTGSLVDISETWVPTEEDYEKAAGEIKEQELDHDFESTAQLYVEPYEKLEIEW